MGVSMATSTLERLISSDDHVDLSHDNIKAYLATRFHDDYDAAIAAFRASAGATASVEANQRWREQQGLGVDPAPMGMGGNRSHAASGRAGHTDPAERLKDMDIDGVDASVTYCEVSAFRYLYMVKRGAKESTRAFNTALAEFASPAPERLVVSYQIPIHDIESAVREVQWAADSGCK